MARSPLVLLALGPVLGFVGYGYFSLFGSFLAELFPTHLRATGQGLTYNLGRGLGAMAPYTIGYLATLPGVGIGSALGLTSAFFVAAGSDSRSVGRAFNGGGHYPVSRFQSKTNRRNRPLHAGLTPEFRRFDL